MERCLLIKGRVQGVGYRYWAVRQAHAVGDISGYAKNLENGDVAVLMQGEENKLNALQIILHKGPLFARVDSVIESPEYRPYFPPVVNGAFRRI